MRRILAAIQSILASFKTVMRPVLRAGKWTLEACTEVVRPVISAADHVVEWTASLPARAIAGVAAQRGGGKNAEAAAEQAAQTVQKKASEADRAALLLQEAGLVQRAAAFRVRGHDWQGAFGDVLPRAHAQWLRQLSVKECELLARADTRQVAAVIGGKQVHITGVRSPADFEALAAQRPPSELVSAFKPAEKAVLDAIGERIRAAKKGQVTYEAQAYANS